MNAERLLALFEQISEAPDAISRLRRFILDLAVRGKLVEQDPEDEPAEELLRNILIDSERNVGKRKARSSSAALSTDPPFVSPKTWVWTSLGMIGDWGSGSTPPRGQFDFYGGDVSWFKSGELNDNKHLAGSEEDVTPLALEKCSFRLNKPGDVLIAMYGATIGKLAILAEPAVTNQAVCACTPSWGVDKDYLYLFLLAWREVFKQSSEGGAQPNISKIKILQTPFPLPPLAEQHRIVAKLDELMALCDQLEAARQQREQSRERLVAASLQRLNQPSDNTEAFRSDARFALQVLPSLTTTPAQIKQLRQTILNLAVRGKLVEQDPEDEPAEGLLNAFSLYRYRLELAGEAPKAKRLPAVAPEEFPEIQGWVFARLGTVCTQITKGSTPTTYGHAFTSEGVNFVKIESIVDGRLKPESIRSFISAETHDFLARSRLQAGDILFSIAGSIGTCAVVEEEFLPANTNQALAIIRGTDVLFLPEFLICALRSTFATSIFQKARGVAMNNVSLGDIQSLVVPLPPLAEQHRIVAKVDELMALCDQLEQQLSQAEQSRRGLLEAVLREALVEPDANWALQGRA